MEEEKTLKQIREEYLGRGVYFVDEGIKKGRIEGVHVNLYLNTGSANHGQYIPTTVHFTVKGKKYSREEIFLSFEELKEKVGELWSGW